MRGHALMQHGVVHSRPTFTRAEWQPVIHHPSSPPVATAAYDASIASVHVPRDSGEKVQRARRPPAPPLTRVLRGNMEERGTQGEPVTGRPRKPPAALQDARAS